MTRTMTAAEGFALAHRMAVDALATLELAGHHANFNRHYESIGAAKWMLTRLASTLNAEALRFDPTTTTTTTNDNEDNDHDDDGDQ